MGFVISKWLVRYKLVHVIGWLALSFVLTFMNYGNQQPLLPQWIGTMSGVTLAFPACYYAANKIVPQYLYKKKIG